MEEQIFICSCHSIDHQVSFYHECDTNTLIVQTHLTTQRNFFERIFFSIKYIFGFKSKYGDWDEFIFKPEDVFKLKEYLNKAEKLSGNLTFEETIEYKILPQLERFIKKEKAFMKDYPNSESEKALAHYEMRYQEYKNFIK
jgi:hypothetical protein